MQNLFPGNGLFGESGGVSPGRFGLPDVDRSRRATPGGRPAGAASSGLVFDAYLHANAKGEGVKTAPSPCTITVSHGGDAVRMRDADNAPRRRGKGSERGKVSGFSRASRLRMLEVCGSIDRRRVGVVFFVTYTTRKGTVTWDKLERRRRALFAAMSRKYVGRFFAIWRKERGEKGMLHLHVLVFWLGAEPHLVNEFRPWNDDVWSRICGEPTMVQSEFMRTWNGVKNYLAEYCAKDSEFEEGDTGRQWGLVNRALIPINRESLPVRREVFKRVCRALAKLERKRREKWFWFADGRWHRYKGKGIHPRSVSHLLPVKRWRPKVHRAVRETIWQEVEEGGRLSFMSPGEEVKAVYPSLRFAEPELVKRLIEWAEKRFISDREDAEGLPF